jgi:hypothetical protein
VPLGFSILKTESKEAMTMNKVESTKYLPGQIRLPNPYVDDNTGSSRKLPSALRNRSGLNASGSGYMVGSCKIALKTVEAKSNIICQMLVSHHAFPMIIAPENVGRLSGKKYSYATRTNLLV